ncbi:MAG: PEP-CTERM sorting domain-containing protein [Gammaproteobacteria bacterium]|nr:PEP-CTERM sorting domain-containing protein [Gammaproteobacteria bacterium]
MIKKIAITSVLLLASAGAQATLVGALSGPEWKVLANDDGGLKGNQGSFDIGPGVDGEGTRAHGGQKYDTEYLLYSIDGEKLTIALQTGFDLGDNRRGDYTSGDLGLSFDGDGKYEYAIDFGSESTYVDGGSLVTRAADAQGLYSVNSWTDETLLYNINGVLTMTDGDLVAGGLTDFQKGVENLGTTFNSWSYYNIMTIDLDKIAGVSASTLALDAYWTMSCGNDVITGRVPEPSILVLMSTGLGLLLGGVAIRRKKMS